MAREHFDIIIVGAGVAGCAIANKVAPDYKTLVLEKKDIGGEASGLAAGLTAPTLFYHQYPSIAEHANRFLRDFDGTGGFTFTERPRIEIVPLKEEQEGKEQADRMASNGFPVSFLDSETAENRYPLFDFSEFAGVIEIRDAGFVDDPYEYTQALTENAKNEGAEFITGVEAKEIVIQQGTVNGVRVDDRVIEASNVVCASGWRTRDLLKGVVDLPLRPFVLQCVTADPYDELNEFPLGRLAPEGVYFRAQHNGKIRFGGGEYLIDNPDEMTTGVTNTEAFREEKQDRSLTSQEAADVLTADEKFKEHVTNVIPAFLRPFADSSEIEFENGWKGVGSATPDGEPIIDEPAEAPDGLFVATGFNGLGVTTAPIAATLVQSLISGEEPPFPEELFKLDRFESRSTGFELQDTFDRGRD